MKTSRKLLASIAVVGTLAAVAVLNVAQNNMKSGASTFLAAETSEDAEVKRLFSEFVVKNQRNFLTKDEYNARQEIFKANLQIVKEHNAKNEGYELEMNKFSDLSSQEFEKLMGFKNLIPEDDEVYQGEEQLLGAEALQAPASIDWRTQNAVTSVKNQGSCGGCYSFAAAVALEGIYAIKKGKLVDLSAQQLIDCTNSYGNMGCSGGLMTNCYSYLKTAKLQTWSSYPYTGKQATCKYNSANGVVGTTGFVNIAKGSPSALMNAVAQQPVSVAIYASSSKFQLYKSGIMNDPTCPTSVNHGVAVVGYGSLNGQNYWLVKNSWGASWGDSGYVKIYNDGQNGNGMCGILTMNSYPTIA